MKPCNKNMSTRRRRGRTDSFVHISLRVVTQETHMNNKAAEMTEINNAQPTLSSTSTSASNSSMNSKRTEQNPDLFAGLPVGNPFNWFGVTPNQLKGLEKHHPFAITSAHKLKRN